MGFPTVQTRGEGNENPTDESGSSVLPVTELSRVCPKARRDLPNPEPVRVRGSYDRRDTEGRTGSSDKTVSNRRVITDEIKGLGKGLV